MRYSVVKVKLINSVFGFDAGVEYNATKSKNGKGYIVMSDGYAGFLRSEDIEEITQ